jgi:hypothetical protein
LNQVGNLGAAGLYLAGVVLSTIEGTGVDVLRTLTCVDGSTIGRWIENV